jgi:hypothetical protein
VTRIACNNEASSDRVLHVANTRAYRHTPAPRLVLAMSHVLDDNVASENRGGRRKFGETEDITLLREIVANDAHVCRRGNVTENFMKVARALNEGSALPGTRSASIATTGTSFSLRIFKGRTERAN